MCLLIGLPAYLPVFPFCLPAILLFVSVLSVCNCSISENLERISSRLLEVGLRLHRDDRPFPDLKHSPGRNGPHDVDCLADVRALVGRMDALDPEAFSGHDFDLLEVEVTVVAFPVDLRLGIPADLRSMRRLSYAGPRFGAKNARENAPENTHESSFKNTFKNTH